MSTPQTQAVRAVLSEIQSEISSARPLAALRQALSEAEDKLTAREKVGGDMNLVEVEALYDGLATKAADFNAWQLAIPDKATFLASIPNP